MKLILRLAATNWVNCAAIAACTYSVGLVGSLLDSGSLYDRLMVGIFGSIFLLIYYGSIFWLGFVACMVVLDMAGLLFLDIANRLNSRTGLSFFLGIESMLISAPFIYWAVKENYYLWYGLVTAFWLSQFLIRLPKMHHIVLKDS
ncbi:hypothetical protein [Hymenobacter sp. HDW8]|uniref:hypothetical protein n=1 Tax=Hymenobacter sp. HDW8 TaxID=2714932 RepID=UPI00140D31EA|nr:hypothetical protein [Hymenobacter sp. HDW8]QIL74865.1 hypothetical protein G7064_02570 [Hymenobacter sp. HDW8]